MGFFGTKNNADPNIILADPEPSYLANTLLVELCKEAVYYR